MIKKKKLINEYEVSTSFFIISHYNISIAPFYSLLIPSCPLGCKLI